MAVFAIPEPVIKGNMVHRAFIKKLKIFGGLNIVAPFDFPILY